MSTISYGSGMAHEKYVQKKAVEIERVTVQHDAANVSQHFEDQAEEHRNRESPCSVPDPKHEL